MAVIWSAAHSSLSGYGEWKSVSPETTCVAMAFQPEENIRYSHSLPPVSTSAQTIFLSPKRTHGVPPTMAGTGEGQFMPDTSTGHSHRTLPSALSSATHLKARSRISLSS